MAHFHHDHYLAIVHLDQSLQVLMAFYSRDLGYSGNPHNRGASAGVRVCLCQVITLTQFNTHDRKDKIAWECDNGGQLWSTSVAAGYDNGSAFPSGFCSSSFESLSTAFIISLLVDLGFQVRALGAVLTSCRMMAQKMEYLTENNICQTYMLFLNWRFSKRLEHYSGMKGPFYGGKRTVSWIVMNNKREDPQDITMHEDRSRLRIFTSLEFRRSGPWLLLISISILRLFLFGNSTLFMTNFTTVTT